MPRSAHPSRFAAPLVSAAVLLALASGCATVAPTGTSSPSAPPAPASATPTTTSPTPSASRTAGATVTAPAPNGLPRGGTQFFPTYRLFGYVGYPGDHSLGRLGEGNVEDRLAEMEKQAADWAGGRTIMPVMELIVTTAVGTPERDGLYRIEASDAVIANWLNVARRHKAILLLDIQPGRANFLDELKRLDRWLAEPDVGVALDPEWAVDANQVPGKVFGNTSGKELDDCASYLAGIVKAHGLPEKVMVYHVLHASIVRNESDLKPHAGVVYIKSVDGIGSPAQKVQTWKNVVAATTASVHMGFKLFFSEDVKRGGRVMTPSEVLGLKPEPEYVLFE